MALYHIVLIIAYYTSFTPTTGSTNDMNLNVLSYNSCGTGSSKPYVCELLNHCNILGISEHWLSGPELYKLDILANSCNKLCAYKCSKKLTNGPPERGRGYGGVAIYWDGALPASPILSIDSDRIVGITLSLCNVNLCIIQVYMPQPRDNGGADYEATLSDLEFVVMEYTNNDYRLIVMGDFNVCLGNNGSQRGTDMCAPYGARLLDVMYNEKCQFICCDKLNQASGPTCTFEREGVGRSWIDHIFVSANLWSSFISCRVYQEDLLNVSDHVPVELVLNVTNVNDCHKEAHCNTVNLQSIAWHKINGDKILLYTKESDQLFNNVISKVEECLNESDMETVTKVLTTNISNVAISTLNGKCKYRHGKSNAKPFWSKELTVLSKDKMYAYNAWIAAGRPRDKTNEIYLNHCASKKNFRKAFRQSEAIYRANLEESIESHSDIDQRQFWYLLRREKKRQKKCNALRDVSGNIVTDENKIMEMWKVHFENLGIPSNDVDFDNEFKNFVNNEITSCVESAQEMNNNVLSKPVDSEEVESVCKHLKCGKAQDLNGLTYEHFKYAGRSVYLILSLLFNCIIRTETLPTDFVKGVTIPLFKGGKKDPLDRDDYRGITIQNVLCKIYDNIILLRCQKVLQEKLGICEIQFACKKGLSSVNASLSLQETVSHMLENGNHVYATFFDTRKAFDTVWVDGLFYLLYHKGIRGKLWRLLRKSYIDSLSAVFINGRLSDWFRIYQGVKQGAIMSMLLYICFINCVIIDLLGSDLGCTILGLNTSCVAYADDIAVLAPDRISTQRLIDIAYSASRKWRFKFSIKKCAVLIFGVKGKSELFFLGNDPIQSSCMYNHVGVNLFTRGTKSICDIKSLINSCKRAFYGTICQSMHKSSMSPLSLSKIYWSVCIAKLLSNAEVNCYSSKELTEFENFHMQMAKDMQLLPCCTPNVSVLANLGWRSIGDYIDYVRIMFIHRIFSLETQVEHRSFVLRRIVYILANGTYSSLSPLALALEALMKYNLLHFVLEWLDTGISVSKASWKHIVCKEFNNHVHRKWRFQLTLFPKLKIYRIVNTEFKVSCWWILAKKYPFLKKPCCTMIKLLCGSNILAVNINVSVPRSQRHCLICNTGDTEDLFHFMSNCVEYVYIRDGLHEKLLFHLSPEGREIYINLSKYMRTLVLLGLNFPMPNEDIWCVRYFSCICVNNMYIYRKSLEPP